MTDRRHLEERREIAIRDLAELAEQVETGEMDPATADTLRANYQAEVDEVETLLDGLPPLNEKRAAAPATEPSGMQPRSTRRAVIGSVAVIAALSVAIFFAARDISPDPVAGATDSAAPGALTVDPDSVSNEQLEAIVAQNPDINAMRLALANRYFEEQDYSKALDHYLTVAENKPTPAEEGIALSRVGWMAYQTGQPEAAKEYLESSLAVDPTNQETKLFLGFVLLYGLEDSEGAIPLLEEIAAIPDLPPEVLHPVEAALDEARNGTGG